MNHLDSQPPIVRSFFDHPMFDPHIAVKIEHDFLRDFR